MPYLTKDNKNILFIKVPRTGSTSLSLSFKRDGWKHVCESGSDEFVGDTAFADNRICSKDHGSLSHHMRRIKKHNLNVDDIQYIFTVLRDPVERVESFFRMIASWETSKECKSWARKKWAIKDVYPNWPNDTLIPIDDWWYQFKDRLLNTTWTKSQAPLVNGILTYTNINQDIFLYKKETFKNIYTTLNDRLNINLPVLHTHSPRVESLYDYSFSDKVKKEIQNYYIKDYELIDKLT